LFAPEIGAQKKGGGGAGATSSSTSGSTGQSASPSAGTSNAPFEVEMLAYGALDQIYDKLATYACSVSPAPPVVGTVNTSEKTVTWISGPTFRGKKTGGLITINGVAYTIDSVTDPKQLVLTTSAGTQTSAEFSFGGAKPFSKVLVLDTPTLQSLGAFDAFYANAQALESAFNSMTANGGAGSGIDDFADVTNAVAAAATASTSETAFTFTIQDPTAAIALLHHLQGNANNICKTAYYAGVYTVDQIGGVEINTVSSELGDLANTRSQALAAIMPDRDANGVFKPNKKTVPCGATATPIGVAAGSGGGAATTVLTVSSSDPCITAFNNLDTTYNSFLAGLSTPNTTTGSPALMSILQGYRLRALFETATDDAPMLGIYLSVAAAGGTQQDRKNLLTNLFTGDWIRYSGGVSVNIIVFQVAEKNSKILFSDLVRYRTPLGNIKKPKGYNHQAQAGDNLNSVQ
jgi:hypothetical protein